MPVDVTENFIHIRVMHPSLFSRYITKNLGKGIKARIGFPKKGGGSKVQSYLFDRKMWTMMKARAWMREHHKSISESIQWRDEIVDWYLRKRGLKQ